MNIEVCPKRRGFTLIELLVVIAIIAILAAILFPVFAQAREKARQIACLSNTKQMGTALMLYTQDYGERYPNQWWFVGPYKNANGTPCGGEWLGTPAWLMQPYIKSVQVWVCPSKTRGAPDPSLAGFLSYGFNYLGVFSQDKAPGDPSGSALGTRGTTAGSAMAQIVRPAQTVAITEVNGSTNVKRIGGGIGDGGADAAWIDYWWQLHSYPNQKSPGPGSPSNTNNRFQTQLGKHSLQVNIAYADGHSKSSRPSHLLWGNFYGVFQDGRGPLGTAYNGKYAGPAGGAAWDSPVSTPTLDQAMVAP